MNHCSYVYIIILRARCQGIFNVLFLKCRCFILNLGNNGYRESIRSKIYVDKTGLIAHTNERIHTEEKYICVSRPRRFGKSMAIKMLAAYYSRGCDSKALFSGKNIENNRTFEAHLNQYDVIFLNIPQSGACRWWE